MKKRIAILLCAMMLTAGAMPVYAEEEVNEQQQANTQAEGEVNEDSQEETADTEEKDATEKETEDVAVKENTENANTEETEKQIEPQGDAAEIAPLANEDEVQKLKDAIAAGGSYTLGADVDVAEQIVVEKDVTLNLGGHTLTSSVETAFAVQDKGDLKISNGTIKAASKMFYIYPGGKLTIDKGEYLANRFVTNIGGRLTVNAGTFKSTSGYCFYLYDDSENYFYGGNIEASSGIAIMNQPIATVGASSDLSKYSNYKDSKYKLTDEEYNTPTKLVWGKEGEEGPSLIAEEAAVYGNFWYSETDITINSGKIISKEDTAIYHPQQGKFTMNGGYLAGASAIEAKMGNFTFNGGYVVGNGEAASDQGSYEDILGGTTANGTALKYELGYYGAVDTDEGMGARGPACDQAKPGGYTHLPRNNDFSLTITNGVFISKNNAPITVKNWNMCTQKASYDITGGRFSNFPKTIEMKHADGDKTTAYGIPVCDTVDTVYSYISKDDYKFAPAAYYDGVGLQYGFEAKDAAYYASLGNAIADRNNDPDARAYIYYLLNNGLSQKGEINRQLQIFYNLEEYCGSLIPENVGMGTDKAVFGYTFNSGDVTYNSKQYVRTEQEGEYALWSPVVVYDANGGKFSNEETEIPVLATVASGLFEGNGYGYVVKSSDGKFYVTKDEKGELIKTPNGTVLVIPEDPVNGNKEFLGWYYEDGTAFDPDTTQIKANMRVYAKWKEEQVVPGTDTPEEVTPGTDTPKNDDGQKVTKETAKKKNKTVKTGDSSNVMVWIFVLAGAGCVAVSSRVYARRKRH